VIAGHGWYHERLGHGVPWMPVAVVGFFTTLLALRRIPVAARSLAAPGMVNRLELPHRFRAVKGTVFLATMALGHLPASVRPARGPGRRRRRYRCAGSRAQARAGRGHRGALRFNAFGMTDLVVALTLGALTGFQLINVTPLGASISELPLALIPTAAVPLLFALHITSLSSLSALVRAPRTSRSSTAPLTAATR